MSEVISDEDLWQLECNIEVQRLERNWTALKVSLEQYSHVFDRSMDRTTKFHASLKEMKSFYWCCTAELSFHSTLDFNASIDAIRRAVAFNVNNIQVRILIAHFLLCISQDSIGVLYPRDRRIGGGSITASNKLSNFDFDQDLSLASILGQYYEVRQSTRKLCLYML